MPGLYKTITRCQAYERQWTDSKARHYSPSLTFTTAITTSVLPKRINTKRPSKHAMECTFRRSCILGCAMHLHSSREPCERISHHSWNNIKRTQASTWMIGGSQPQMTQKGEHYMRKPYMRSFQPAKKNHTS